MGFIWDVTRVVSRRAAPRSLPSLFVVAASADGRLVMRAWIPQNDPERNKFLVTLFDAHLLSPVFSTPPRSRELFCAALSPDNRFLVAGSVELDPQDSETTLVVWDW